MWDNKKLEEEKASELTAKAIDHAQEAGQDIREKAEVVEETAVELAEQTKEKAIDIYVKDYWNKSKCDDLFAIHPFIAYHVFDFGVNAGPARANMHLQKVINVLNDQGRLYPNMIEDGAIGPTTLRHLDAFIKARGKDGLVVLINALITLQGAHYIELMTKNEKREAFGLGWLRRASDKFNVFNDMQ